MDPFTRLMGKTSLMYLGFGFVLGGVLLIGEAVSAGWVSGWGAVHAHILFVGWFVQFAIGIGYWLLPRRKTPEKPYGYNETVAYCAYGLLNSGLMLRILIEPFFVTGAFTGPVATLALSISGVLQSVAGLILACQLWGRFFLRYTASNQPVKKMKEKEVKEKEKEV